jgi:hypothetical protein
MELDFADVITNPVEAYVNCLGALLLDGVICNTSGRAVVSDDGSAQLGMAQFFQTNTLGTCGFAPVEECGKFGFGGTGDDFA